MTAGTFCPDPPRIDALIEKVLKREPNVAPPVRSRTLQEWTGVIRRTVDDVRHGWSQMPFEKREWLRLWAIDDLPKPGPLERLVLRLASGVVYAAHPDDVSDFIAEGKILREAVLTQVATTIWQQTLDDENFASDFAIGVGEIAAGKGVHIKPNEL